MKPDHITISEFMGRKFQPRKGNSIFLNESFDTFKECEVWIRETNELGFVPALGWGDFGENYETDWNLLMKVVEKIESLGLTVFINDTMCTINVCNSKHGTEDEKLDMFLCKYHTTTFRDNTKKLAVWNSVISFVEEYNKYMK